MRSTLVTGIGEPATCDGTEEGGAGTAPRRRAGGGGQPHRLGRRGCRRPPTDHRVDVEGRAGDTPVSSTRTVTSSSPGTGRRNSPPGWRGRLTRAGGIGFSVRATRAATDDELRVLLRARVAEMRAQGTTAVEIKSGYGLTVEDEAQGPAHRPGGH